MVLVIFSMFLMDLRRPSISRRVAKVAALAGAGLLNLAVSNCRHCSCFTSIFRQIVDVEVVVGVRRVEGPWHVSDENLPSDGSTTSPQGRADGTGEHSGRDVEKRVDEQGSS